MKLPVSRRTFGASFLSGKGKLEIATPDDAWGTLFEDNAPFKSSTTSLAVLNLDIAETSGLVLGRPGAFQLAVSADGSVAGRIRLIRSPDDPLLVSSALSGLLKSGQMFAALELSGHADGSAQGSYVAGPLTPTFGLKAGGRVDYIRLMLFPADTPARGVIENLLKGARLPQAVDVTSEVPVPGELLALEYGGYLDLSAGLRWGYTLSGLSGFDLGKLDLALAYEAEIGAHADLHYRVAGDFRIEALAGHAPGWLRLIVRKRESSQFDFAADIGLNAALELRGLPADADAFLEALLGTDVESWIRLLAEATRCTDVKELERRVDSLSWDFLQRRSHQWLGRALDEGTASEFLGVVKTVVAGYQALDERVLRVVKSFRGRLPALRAGVAALEAINTRESLGNLADPVAWEIVQTLVGDRLFDVLLEEDPFRLLCQHVNGLQGVLGDTGTHVLGLIDAIQEDYDLGAVFEQLADCRDAKALRALFDEKLKGIVERLTGKAFDEIAASRAGGALKSLHQALAKLQAFKEAWYKRLQSSVKQTCTAKLAYAFRRANRDERLLDVEVDLSSEEGRALAREATAGRFARVLGAHDPTLVRVRKGLFTHGLEKTAQLRVNVYGWESSSLTRVISDFEHSIEADPSGLIHVYAIKALADRRRERGRRVKESVSSTFLFAAIARALQRPGASAPADLRTGSFLAETLDHISVQYDLAVADQRTTLDELTAYLALGERLGLVADANATARQFAREFPDGFGEVTARYTVRYDDKGLLAAFTLSGDELRQIVQKAVRQLVAAQYSARANRAALSRAGFAYLSSELARTYYTEGYTAVMAQARTVTLPAWFAGNTPREQGLTDADRQILVTLYGVEKELVTRLVELDAVVDRCLAGATAVPVSGLEKASLRFVEMFDDVDKFGGQNTFFGVFDAVVRAGSGGKGRHQSALVLEITPPEGAEKVTKVLTA